jgi:uncharacterized protein (TIGR00369 family)
MTGYPRFENYPGAQSTAAERRAWADAKAMSHWCGLRCLDIDFGHYTCVMADSPLALNPDGGVNGGATAAAADHCMDVVAATILSPDALGLTAALTAKYHRPAYPPRTFKAHVTSHGRTVLFVQVDVEDRDGGRCTQAHGTLVVRRMKPATEGGPSSLPAAG